jgi:tetratricopeptide (TPR) repeat protein
MFILISLVAAPPSARQLVDEAQRAYAKSEFLEAARLLEAASKIDPSGRIVFNLARAWEKANNVEQAIILYEAYLERPDAELPAMKRARKALAALYRIKPSTPDSKPEPSSDPEPKPIAELKLEPTSDSKPEPTSAQQEARSTPSAEFATEPVTAKTVPAKVEASSAPSPRTKRAAGLVALTVGGIAAGTGVGFGLWAQATATEARASLDPIAKPQLIVDSQHRATLTDITFALAATLAVTGAVFLLIDWFGN